MRIIQGKRRALNFLAACEIDCYSQTQILLDYPGATIVVRQSRSRSTAALPPIQTQIDRALRSVKQAQVWTYPKKQKRLEKLLAELEQLMSG